MKTTTRIKTILIAGNLCGGLYKSTTIATLGDCLQTLGHSVQYIDLDVPSNQMLQKLQPKTVGFDPRFTGYMSNAMDAAIQSPEDITIIDCPGGTMDAITKAATMADDACSARIVIGIIINAKYDYPLIGGIEFAKTFGNLDPEFIILANNWEDTPNVLLETPEGKLLSDLAQGRVIQFPPYSDVMKCDFRETPAVPTLMADAKNPIAAAPWKSHHEETLQSVAKLTEWLVGKSIPHAASNLA